MLSGAEILEIFEEGRELHPVDRGLLLLARAHPDIPHAELASFTAGRRDASLVRLRARHFGNRLEARAACPRCNQWSEMELSCSELFEEPSGERGLTQLRLGTKEVELRAPNSRDLAAIAASASADEARARLLERCTSGADLARLSEGDQIALADAIVAADPHAEKLLALSCPTCGHDWHVLFDVVSYVWNEIAAEARRVLREVDILARTYGWNESEILGLSAMRRQLYVEMALS